MEKLQNWIEAHAQGCGGFGQLTPDGGRVGCHGMILEFIEKNGLMGLWLAKELLLEQTKPMPRYLDQV